MTWLAALMNSSRRSSTRSTRTSLPSVWRSSLLTTTKNTTPPSLTIVFAEPEQGTPLDSALASLPPCKSTDLLGPNEMPPSNPERPTDVSSSNPVLREEQRSDDGSKILPAAESDDFSSDAVSTAASPAAGPSSVTMYSQASVALADDSRSLQSSEISPIPSSSSQNDSPSLPQNARSLGNISWLGSLSRAKGKEKLTAQNEMQVFKPKNDPPSFSDTSSVGVLSVPSSNSSVVSEAQKPAQPDSSAKSTKDMEVRSSSPSSGSMQSKRWLATASSSRTPMSPSPLGSSHSSAPSSADEEVTQPAGLSPPSLPSENIAANSDGENQQNQISLNPSTSRFTISIPFLGRPKIPLDQAVAVARAGDHNQEPFVVESAPTNTPGPNAAIQVNLPERADKSASAEGTTVNLDPSTSLAQHNQSTSDTKIDPGGAGNSETSTNSKLEGLEAGMSWWGYIGFKAADTKVASGGDSVRSDSQSVTNAAGLSVESLPEAPLSDVEVYAKKIDDSSNKPDSNNDVFSSSEENNASSTNDPTASASQTPNSAWYTPWGWYNSSAASLPARSGNSSDKPQPIDQPVLKEQSIVGGESVTDGNSSLKESPSKVDPLPEILNPIQSSISTNKSAWSSFFSAKALSMKAITNNEGSKDENGMEVMVIDDEDTSASASTPGATVDVPSTPTSFVKNRDGSILQQGPDSKILKPSIPSAKQSDSGKETPPTPPSTPPPNTESTKRETTKVDKRKSLSPAPSKAGPPPVPPPPNIVLPTWEDIFHFPPRSIVPSNTSRLMNAIKAMSGVLFSLEEDGKGGRKAKDRQFRDFGKALPRAWDAVGDSCPSDILRGCKRVVVIGIHGWFPGPVVRTVTGEPTGTSTKFVNMMVQAIEDFQEKHKVKIQKITKIPLEGEGTIERRVDRLYQNLLGNLAWMDDLHNADAIFIATHSQGSIVSTHLLDRLIADKHINTQQNVETRIGAMTTPGISSVPNLQIQKVCCLCLCGIHLGPLRYLRTNFVVLPYIQYFESMAARELFEFQNTENEVSKVYVKALKNVVDHGVKMVFVASLNDQVVPVCSALFTAARHPLILRALYIDGDAYNSSDFLSKLLVLLLRIMNSGLSDSGLLAHLSEVTAGSLRGVGHSSAYEELACYSLAVKYMFLTNDGLERPRELVVESFDATMEQNDYEIPWSLRDLIADERVSHFFAEEISNLRDAFRVWHPKTAILRDIKRKLQPIQRLPSNANSSSKL